MRIETFDKGIQMLMATFQNRELHIPLYRQFLTDLDDEAFEKSIIDIIKNVPTLYPNDNLIAMIRERAEGDFLVRFGKKKKLLEKESEKEKLDRWQREAIPMPSESKKLLKKLAIGKRKNKPCLSTHGVAGFVIGSYYDGRAVHCPCGEVIILASDKVPPYVPFKISKPKKTDVESGSHEFKIEKN